MNSFKLNNTKGITLVALVVTIIVLIILAGISISLVLGNNGIITKAKDARNNYIKSANEEQSKLDNLYEEMNEQISKINEGEDIKKKGIESFWPEDNSTKPYLPDKTKFHISEKEQSLDEGLIIVDNNDNEYVWIEVPKTISVYGNQEILNYELDKMTQTELTTALTEIENALHTYVNPYREGLSNNDNYNSAMGALGNITGKDSYDFYKNKMIKSIFDNGGFWVGRYEAGMDDFVTENRVSVNNIVPLTKANKYPVNFVTCSQAQILASNAESGEYTSSLMFGIQWDLMLKFIEEAKVRVEDSTKQEAVRTEIQSILKNDSKSIGNYYPSSYKITDTEVSYSTNKGQSYNKVTLDTFIDHTVNKAILLTTGAKTTNDSNTNFQVQNLNDIAGNIWEWTIEYSANTSDPCVLRGGNYYDGGNGSYIPASGRFRCVSSNSNEGVGFRITIY